MFDPITARMRDETGHECDMCPNEVRNLRATAHNLLNRIESGEWASVARKAADLRRAVDALEETNREHFAALDGWRRP